MAELSQLARTIRGASSRARRPSPQLRYMAFLSYSHQDSEIAAWLHEELEEFHVPARLVGKLTEQGPVPKRLAPIFRDRHELAAASDLGEEIEDAIAGSRFLIVLCSPAAAKSRWIDKEIACFKRLHREDRVLAAIVDGEPLVSASPGREEEECFPPSLRTHFDSRGRATSQPAEPIAADLREEGDGRRMGVLKLAAGMMGVGLDDLVQREAQRRHRRLYAITAASVAGMLFTSGLAYTAIDARNAARDQRREAEGLIGFMLGDLREKLEPIGKLEALDVVGARALAYYEKQDKGDLGDAALAQRSKALTLMGEIAQLRGDPDGALRRYREAMAGTAEIVRRRPDNPQNLFDHAQNVFWVGYIDYQRGDLDRAAAAFREYRRLADRMISLAPNQPDYQLERNYANTNLGTVLMAQRRYRDAAATYQALLGSAETLAAGQPANLEYQKQLVSALAWLADAREYSGHLDEALALRTRESQILSRLWYSSRGDTVIKRREMTSHRAIARLLASRGDLARAMQHSNLASNAIKWLARTEPENTEWIQAGARANFERANLERAAGRLAEARAATEAACNASARLIAHDRSVVAWRTTLQLDCLNGQARLALKGGAAGEAVPLAQQAVVLARTEAQPVERALAIATAEMTLGDALLRSGQVGAARGAFERAHSAWPKSVEQRPSELAQRAVLLRRLGRNAEAAQLTRRLNAMGYQHPEFKAK